MFDISVTPRWALLLFFALPCTAISADSSTADIAASLVKVHVVTSAPDFSAPWQLSRPEGVVGSGVVIDGNLILTNAHVVADQVNLEVQRGGVGKRFSAQVQHVCDPCDLALLSVADERFFDGAKAIEIGELPKAQQPVHVYGFPEGGEGPSVTEGVVSRIQVDIYSHARNDMLMVQVDAAINSGNSGGPVVSDGKIVGISMQTLEDAENIADIVPAPVIRHFLADVSDGSFDGFPELGVELQKLDNDALRESLGMASGSHGVLVTAVSRRGSAHGVIRPGDVILAIDEVPILEDGNVEVESAVHVNRRFVEHRSQVGDEISVSLMRDGRKLSRTVEMLAPRPLVPLGDFDRSPDYRIFGGLVFQALTVRYLTVFEEDSPPDHLARLRDDPSFGDYELLGAPSAKEHRREIVVLIGFLSNELTRGYDFLEDEVVYAVDGEPVKDLAHLSWLLDSGDSKLVTIMMERSGAKVVLDRAEARRITPELLNRYQVAADRSPGLMVARDKQSPEQPSAAAAIQ